MDQQEDEQFKHLQLQMQVKDLLKIVEWRHQENELIKKLLKIRLDTYLLER